MCLCLIKTLEWWMDLANKDLHTTVYNLLSNNFWVVKPKI